MELIIFQRNPNLSRRRSIIRTLLDKKRNRKRKRIPSIRIPTVKREVLKMPLINSRIMKNQKGNHLRSRFIQRSQIRDSNQCRGRIITTIIMPLSHILIIAAEEIGRADRVGLAIKVAEVSKENNKNYLFKGIRLLSSKIPLRSINSKFNLKKTENSPRMPAESIRKLH